MLYKIIFNIDEIPFVIKEISKKINDAKIITFQGPLGAGKTTIIRNLLQYYGVIDEITSPTFNYLNIYKNDLGKLFFHFDLYRIKSIDEFLMQGFNEYFFIKNSICLIEWPEIIEPLLKSINENIFKIIIDYQPNNKRILEIQTY